MTVKVYAYPFELGFLEFLYLATFHDSLTIWLFRKKCLIVVMCLCLCIIFLGLVKIGLYTVY